MHDERRKLYRRGPDLTDVVCSARVAQRGHEDLVAEADTYVRRLRRQRRQKQQEGRSDVPRWSGR